MKSILILGGTHGVEPQSTYVAEKLAQELDLSEVQNIQYHDYFKFFQGLINNSTELRILPDLNRYGLANKTRGNAHGVDLNRNMPSINWSSSYTDLAYLPGMHPASETETKLLVSILEQKKPDLIISIHTNHYVKHHNPPQVNYDGPLESWGHDRAKILSEILDLPFTHDIGYATPVSLGSYSKDHGISCATLEMEDEFTNQGAWAKYGIELEKFLKTHLN